MEPLDSDFEYVVREPKQSRWTTRAARFNWMLILPALGALWLLYLAMSALFQWSVSGVVSPVMTLMLILLFVAAGLLFWAQSPSVRNK